MGVTQPLDDDEIPESFPTDGLTPRGVHQADQIIAAAKDMAVQALKTSADPDVATAEVFEKLLELRDVDRKPGP